jgi:hypothetical protein
VTDHILIETTRRAYRLLGSALPAERDGTRAPDAPPTRVGLADSEIRNYSIARAIRSKLDGTWLSAGCLEREAHNAIVARGIKGQLGGFLVPDEVQHRSLSGPLTRADTAGVAGAGGYLVATQLISFIDLLRARSVCLRLGATLLPDCVGNIAIPKLTGAATAYWLGSETTQITEKEQAFGQLAMSPKNVGGYTEISRQLLRQSKSAEIIVSNDLAAILALAVDLGALNGSGAAGQPLGIMNTGGVGSITGTAIALAGIIKFQTNAAAANSDGDSFAYAAAVPVAEILKNRQRFSGSNTSLWTGGLFDGFCEDERAMSSTAVPAGTLIGGPFSTVAIAEWNVLEIAANEFDQNNFKAGLVGIRALWTIDIGVRYPGSWSVATGVT